MATGNAKSNYYGIVINPPKNEPYRARLEKYQNLVLESLDFSFTASIIHDKDSLQDGTLKTIHLHIYLQTTSMTKNQLLDLLTSRLDCNKEQISIDTTNNEVLLVQYLTHKNAKDKHQYDYNLIKTNNPSKLKVLYDTKYTAPLSSFDIEAKLQSTETFTQFLNEVGIENAKKYQSLWDRLQKDKQQINKDAIIKDLQGYIELILSTIDNCLTTSEKKHFFLRAINYDDLIERYLTICDFHKLPRDF